MSEENKFVKSQSPIRKVFLRFPPNYYELSREEQNAICVAIARQIHGIPEAEDASKTTP